MGNIHEWLKKQKERELSTLISEDFLSKQGKGYDYLHKNDYGYTSLTKRWKDLYNKALGYYNNEGYKTFADKYNGTINTEGYVNKRDTDKWYRELEEMSKKDNEGIEELLAELDQYSRYYNEDAVKYVRDLISEKQKAYSDVMTDAGKFRDHWAKWATEDDYNNAVWESDFASKLEAGDVAGASQMYQDRFSQNPPAEGDTKASEYMDYINAARYNGWVDKYKNMSADELLAAKEQLSRDFTGNAFNKDPMGNFNTQNAERGMEIQYVDYLYQLALDNNKKKEYAAYDADAGQAEIDYLQGFATRANEIKSQIAAVDGEINKRRAKGQNVDDLVSQKARLQMDLYQLSEEYRGATTDTVLQNHNKITGQNGGGLPDFSDLVDFDALLSQATADHTTAMRYRDNSLMSLEPLDDPEFNSKSQYVPSQASSRTTPNVIKYGYEDPVHEYINGDDGVRSSIEDAYLLGDVDGTKYAQLYESFSKYADMTDDQIALYNYYYNTEGAEAAKKYLNSIDEELKTRKGFSNYEKYFKDESALLKALYSIPVGLDQFKSGITGIFADGYTPASPTQITGQLIREDLADESIPLWYNFKEGEWEDEVFGSSLGQMGYDLGSTTANMLPSVLASAAVNAVAPGAGAVVGAGLMGASAGGNAKTEMLNLGYSKEQAEAYGLLVGVAEGGMEYLLGGISSLGGKLPDGIIGAILNKVDNALARVAITVGGEMLSEGFEEGLQTVIEPWLKQVATNVDWEDPSVDEVLYSSLLGALSSLGMSAPGTVANGIGTAINNRQERIAEGSKYAADPQSLIDESLALDPNNKLAQRLKEKLESSKTISEAELGRLSIKDSKAISKSLSEQDATDAEREATAKEDAAQELKEKIENKIAGKIERTGNEKTISSLAETVVKAARGENVSNSELRRLSKSEAGIAALNNEFKLKNKLKVGASVSQIRQAIASRQSAQTKLSSENVLATYAAHFNMDESAERSLMVNYATDRKNAQNSENLTPEGYAAVYGVVYAAGKRGTDITEISADAAKVLSKTAMAQAYLAGQNAATAENSQNDLSNGENSDTIIKNAQEVQDEQGVYLRDSGERNRGTNPQGQIPGMEGYAGQDQSRGESGTRPRDSEAASLSYDREEVSAKSLGIKGGRESGKVRMVAEGSETASMKEAKRIAAERGLNVHFFGGGNLKISSGQKIIFARAYIQGNDVYIRADHSRFTADQLMRHEAGHDMIAKGEVNVADVRKLINERFTPEEIDAVSSAYALAYKDTGLDVDEIWEEVVCDSLADMNVFEGRKDYEAAAEMAADFLPDLKEATLESKKESRGPPKEAQVSGKISDANFSIEFAEDIAENQRAYVERGNAAISAEELEAAIETTAKMVEAMKPYAKILPQDKVGKTLVKNGSYDMSVENTTICIRTLAYNSFVDMVSEKVGRPLTQMESFLVSQKLYEIAKEPQCLYCYVSLDRKAFNEMVIRYVEQRDAAIEAYKKAGEPKIPSAFNAEWSLFKSFLEGRKPTQNMWDRYVGWIKAYKNGDRLVTLSDISTEAKRAKLVEDGGKTSAQVVDILKYAQSASWAKKQTQYVAYYDEILKLKPGVIKNLNSHYGMRWYSFSDYSGAFIVENMQQVTDAAIRGLKGLSYTKDTDYAEIFAPTGMNINISVYAMKGKDGYVIDPKQSADIDKAIKLRKQYPNVGIVVVATDKAGVEWALAQEWSDVVIPFHTVRTGADVANFYKWEIFNSEQSDVVSDQNLWDAYVKNVGKKKVSKNVYPSEHQNNRETYLQICAERGLTPRFNSFIDNPNYMKLVNETRQSEAQTQPLKPDFNLEAAERSFDKFVDKGGYYEGWYNDGIDVDGEADIVAEDVRAGKKANEVDYGRQDVDFDSLKKSRKDNRTHGRASQDLFEEFDEDVDAEVVERERSTREMLANMLERDDMSSSQKGMLTQYKNKIAQISENEARIASMTEELRALNEDGKGKGAKAENLRNKIRKLEQQNANYETAILNLEATKPIKRLLERERRAAYQEGLLAGQMAQGKDTAPKLRKTEEELATTKQKSKEKLAKYKRLAAQRESEALLAGQMAQGRKDAEILRKTEEELATEKEKLAELRQKRKDDLDALSKRYLESRAKSVEGRRRTKLKEDIRGVVQTLDTLLRKGNKKSNVKIGLQDAVAAALEAFDINTGKVDWYAKEIARLDAKIAEATDPDVIAGLIDRREKTRRNSEVLADKLAAMKKAYEDIHNNKDEGENYPAYYRAEAKTIMDRISDTLAKVGDTPINEMTSDQLKAVYDMYRMVLTTVRDANKTFINGKLEDLTENANDVTQELQKIKKLPEERLKAGDNARGFVWNELTPYYAFKRIGSETLMRYYDELVRGQDVYARDLDEAKNFAENLRKRYKADSWNRNKVVAFKDKDGKSFKLNLGQMMSIYAYSKREQALDHMEKGGFFFNNEETFRTDKFGLLEFISSNETGYKIDAAALARIKSALTADQVAYVDKMQAYLTDIGAKGNEVSRQMWGIDIFNEKVYFPLKSKDDFIYQANTPAETSSLKNDGMTKETKPHASNPIVLESFDEVWANHVNKMSMYHGFVVPIDNLNKLINYGSWIDGDAQSISTMLEARYSRAVNNYLTTFIKDLNGAKSQNGSLLGVMSNWLTKFKKTAVAASLSVVVQQPTAILRATSEIDAKYFAHLPKAEKLNSKWDRIQKYAPIAIIKDIGGFDAGSGRQITEWLNADTQQGVKKAMNKLDDLTMYGAALGDRVGWGAIWTAVEREVQAKQKLQYGTEEFWQACGKRFTDVIVKTQVYDSTLSRSGFMRGKDGLLKMATAFMGEPTLSINMLADAVLQGKRGTMKKRQVIRTVAAVYTATIAASVIKSLVYALRDDDEDESFAEKYMQALGGSVLNDVNPLSMLPIFRDVVSILDGWEVERTDMAIVQDLYNAFTALSSENKTTWRKIEDLAGALGALAGVPAKNLLRTAREIYNAINDTFDGIEGGDVGGAFIEGVTGKEKSKAQTLYEALIGGEKERIAAIRKGYKTDEDYNTAVRTALRKYDPRIKKAAQALYEGDLLTRNEIMLDILGEGVFDKTTVDKAIDAELQAIKSAENESNKSEDADSTDGGSIYSANDINLAFDYNTEELALEIIAELTEIKVTEKLEAARAKAEAKGNDFDEDEAREEAEYEVASSLRSTMKKYWKPKYQQAYEANDTTEMYRIEDILYASGLYEYKSSKTLDDVLDEWLYSDEE